MGVNNSPRVATRQCTGRESSPQSLDHESSALATTLPSHLISPIRKLRCCRAQLLRNFRFFVHPRNFCHGAQLSCNFGSFWAVLALIVFQLGKNLGQIGTFERPQFFLSKICSRLSRNFNLCLFLPPCFFTLDATGLRVARLITLQRIQYSL